MTILIDADACPVVSLIERMAQQYGIPLLLFCDTNHQLVSKTGQVITIGAGADAVDFALINRCQAGDLVVTQDYGVASLALGKGAFCLHQSGREFTKDNIDGLLMDRHLAKKARQSHQKTHLRGPKKRTKEDDKQFEAALCSLLRREGVIP